MTTEVCVVIVAAIVCSTIIICAILSNFQEISGYYQLKSDLFDAKNELAKLKSEIRDYNNTIKILNEELKEAEAERRNNYVTNNKKD